MKPQRTVPPKSSAAKQSSKTVVAPLAKSKKVAPIRVRERTVPGGRELTFREYVQDVLGSVNFAANLFAVQPGLAQLFAWLSSQAISYQEYEFKSLRFEYTSEKSASTNGKLMLAFQPDATDAAPASKQEMLENEEKATCAVWDGCVLTVERREALGQRRYIRSGALAANLDIKTYDIGQLIVATNGCADTSAIGELWVEYTVVLAVPVISIAAVAKATSLQLTGASPSQTSVFGTTPTLVGGLDATATVNTITFNRAGSYLLLLRVQGTGLFTSFQPTISSSTATVTLTSVTYAISNAAANAGTAAVAEYTVVVSARQQTAVFDCSGVSTTITGSSTLVAAYSVA